MQAEHFTCWDCSHSFIKDCTAPFLSLGHFWDLHLFCGVFCGLQGPQLQLPAGHVVPCQGIISISGLQTEQECQKRNIFLSTRERQNISFLKYYLIWIFSRNNTKQTGRCQERSFFWEEQLEKRKTQNPHQSTLGKSTVPAMNLQKLSAVITQ